MTALIVDWLGRGGIAETTDRWRAELGREGEEPLVASLAGRDLAVHVGPSEQFVPGPAGALVRHRRLANAAALAIHEYRPATVIVQNYVVPALEDVVYRAARRVGSRVVMVIHDHRANARFSGNRLGLRAQLRRADVVVCHSEFVRAGVVAFAGSSIACELVPLPTPVGCAPVASTGETAARPSAVHFGILKRKYKGSAVVAELAALRPNWRYLILGVGAPAVAGAIVRREFLGGPELRAAVASADVAVFPYRHATQSGAVRLAQALGTVVVASAVGGVVEQVDDGVTGRLVRAGASASEWASVLDELAEASARRPLAAAALRSAVDADAEFSAAVRSLAA